MVGENIFIWNVRGLNSRARRDVVGEFVQQERASVACQNRWARDIVGAPTTQVICHYLHVWGIHRGLGLDPLQEDRFVWRWIADGNYSAVLQNQVVM